MPDGGAPSEPPVEIEVKFAVHDSTVIRRLLEEPDPSRLAGFEANDPLMTDEVVDLYLDTSAGDGALRAAGMRARLRVSARGVVLAVKGRASVGPDGVATRMELQAPATADLDPSHWPPSDARALLLEATGAAQLVEIAALRQRRHARTVRRGSTIVELSLDELAALEGAGGVVDTRVEFEAELKAGEADQLAELARALAVVDGLGPPLGSKLEFALAARSER